MPDRLRTSNGPDPVHNPRDYDRFNEIFIHAKEAYQIRRQDMEISENESARLQIAIHEGTPVAHVPVEEPSVVLV